MAVNMQRLSPIQQARTRRLNLPSYLNLDGSRYLLGVVILLCLMSLIALAQTGVVATKGYAITQLEQQQTELLRERASLELQLAEAQSLERIRSRAEELGLRPITKDQVRYMTIDEDKLFDDAIGPAGANASESNTR